MMHFSALGTFSPRMRAVPCRMFGVSAVVAHVIFAKELQTHHSVELVVVADFDAVVEAMRAFAIMAWAMGGARALNLWRGEFERVGVVEVDAGRRHGANLRRHHGGRLWRSLLLLLL